MTTEAIGLTILFTSLSVLHFFLFLWDRRKRDIQNRKDYLRARFGLGPR